MINWQKLKTDVDSAYGEGELRNYRFASKRYSLAPYSKLIAKLKSEYEIVETTDLNDDVSVCLSLGVCCLRLSLVGRYAAISLANSQFLSEQNAPTELDVVLRLLFEHNVSLIGPDNLLQTILLVEGPISVFELLFSSDEAIWIKHPN